MGDPVKARAAASQFVKKEAGAERAALLYDHVRLKNRQPAREMRVVVDAAGSRRAFLFAQAYQLPRAGTPFTTVGEVRLIGPTTSIFPK